MGTTNPEEVRIIPYILILQPLFYNDGIIRAERFPRSA